MTLQQGLAFLVLAGTMGLFVWGRLRYDLVAVIALLAAVAVGVVPAEEAFAGFSNDIVIIVGSALVVSAGVARAGVIERVVLGLAPHVRRPRTQLILLVTSVAAMSALVKNIGALAIMMPVAYQMAKRSGSSVSSFLMPMAFASLLGGLMTLVGTSPNVVVSQMRQELTGRPFEMFDYMPVGLGLALVGVAFLAVGYRLLPVREPSPAMSEALDITDYTTEARVAAGSAAKGRTIAELAQLTQGEIMITALVRADRPAVPLPGTVLREGDVVVLEGTPEALERTIAKGVLELEGHDRSLGRRAAGDEIGAIEAVIGAHSLLVGRAAGRVELHARFGINLLAVSRSGGRVTQRLRDVVLRAGDVIVLQGVLSQFPARLRDLGCLPLASRSIPLGLRRSLFPIAILGIAMVATALGLVSVELAFFAAAAFTVLSGALPVREAYESVEWPILIMLGALIPVSEAIRTTGGTTLLAEGLSQVAVHLPPLAALALIMVAAMAVTPFLNNAATVLVMAPIAAAFATTLGYRVDPYLMAVAVGAACDFLTPIGHQCNTLVMGPGGYRFGDYWRLGLPLSVLVVVLGVPLIALVWPLQ